MIVSFDSPELKQDLDAIVAEDLNSQTNVRWNGVFSTCCSKINKSKIALSKDVIDMVRPLVTKIVVDHPRGTKNYVSEAAACYKSQEESRYFVMKQLGESCRREFLYYFQDALGNIRIDSEHLALFLDIMRNKGKLSHGSAEYAQLEDLMYYMRGSEVMTELDNIEKYIKKIDKNGEKVWGLAPSISKLQGQHKWTICQPVMYNYFAHFSIPDGDKIYYFEPELLALRVLYSYLTKTPFSQVGKVSEVVYSGLTPELENMLIPHIFNGHFKNYDGALKKKIYEYENTLGKENMSSIFVLNLYTLEIVARAEAIIGRYAGLIAEELNSNPNYTKEQCEIFFLNHNLIALRAKPNIDINALMPLNGKYFRRAGVGSPWCLFNNKI